MLAGILTSGIALTTGVNGVARADRGVSRRPTGDRSKEPTTPAYTIAGILMALSANTATECGCKAEVHRQIGFVGWLVVRKAP